MKQVILGLVMAVGLLGCAAENVFFEQNDDEYLEQCYTEDGEKILDIEDKENYHYVLLYTEMDENHNIKQVYRKIRIKK